MGVYSYLHTGRVMPKYTIYIKNEDDPKWQAIADKPEWLQVALNTSVVEMAINQDKDQGQPSITYKGEIIIGSMNVSAIERILESEKPFTAQKAKEREELDNALTECKGCGHLLNSVGRCTNKTCKQFGK